jgi:glutamyl-tRNA reductase
MSVLVVGVSHRTAPVPVLERVTIGVEPASGAVLDELRSVGPVHEAVVLSTCNRVEVYADTEGFHAGVDAITDLLAQRSGVPLEELERHLYVHWEGQAVQHLFTVAAGLDSMVVGESQILGQLRSAYGRARDGAAGRTLHELFQKALHVGKRVHTETGIDEAGQSLVSVALERASDAVGELAGRPVLVVGAGSMGALAGATLKRGGAGRIVVANRTPEGARRLATALEGEGTGLDDLAGRLAEADVVVSCTGATGVVVPRAAVEAAVTARGGRPLALLDLALPHDVDPSVADLPGVTLVTLSSLQEVLAGTGTGEDVEAARRIVTEGVAQFLAWQRASRVAPTVVALRSRAEQLVEAEVARLEGRLPELDERARQEVAASLKRVVGALLHTPTVRVKELSEAPAGLSYAEALRELFGLDRAAPAAVAAGPVALEPAPPRPADLEPAVQPGAPTLPEPAVPEAALQPAAAQPGDRA